ncbi:MAG: LysR family transcriptional regulator [Labilithrix sp.]|nr:LysR family transcriptional regulator [Labilithrix sp.]
MREMRKKTQPFDGVTLDQLRVLVAVADAGTFSAAARDLGRAQSGISQAMAGLEALVGFKVWDRAERSVVLTARGHTVVSAARRVLGEVDRLRDIAKGLETGHAERLALCVDAVFPPRGLVALARAMQEAFPALELRIETDTMAAVGARVARRDCDVGIATPLAASEALERVAVGSVLLVPVAARGHRLAAMVGPIPNAAVFGETQIVLSERDTGGPRSPDQGVLSARTWRVADLSAKRELIAGLLGWGNLPEALVHDDLARGDLLRLELEAWSAEQHRLPLALVFPAGLRKKPIIKWLATTLPGLCAAWGVGLER